jgi:hypothetical protein
MQELFFTGENFIPFLLSVINLIEKRLSKKAKLLYLELLKKSFVSKSDKVYVSYRTLEHTYKHSHEYFRSAFEELENKGYAYRENKNKKKDFYVKVIKEKAMHDFEVEFNEFQKYQLQQSKEDNHENRI